MSEILQTIINAIVGKVGGVPGFIIKQLLEVYRPKLANYLTDLFEKLKRNPVQNATLKKVEEDVKEQKPRTDEVRKNEKDYLNS